MGRKRRDIELGWRGLLEKTHGVLRTTVTRRAATAVIVPLSTGTGACDTALTAAANVDAGNGGCVGAG